jgi:hypothetical protein
VAANPELSQILDQINQYAVEVPDDEATETLLGMVERAAEMPGGLTAIVQRFGNGVSPLLTRSIAFVLAQRADSVAMESACRATVEMIQGQISDNDPATLINCLTALQRLQIHECAFTAVAPEAGTIITNFFIHCLQQALPVQLTAIDVLLGFAQDQWFLSHAKQKELGDLEQALRSIADIDNTIARDDLKTIISLLEMPT